MSKELDLESATQEDVAKEQKKLLKDKQTLGRWVNRVGRTVIGSYYVYKNSRDNKSLPLKKDGFNVVDFEPLSEAEIKKMTEKNQALARGVKKVEVPEKLPTKAKTKKVEEPIPEADPEEDEDEDIEDEVPEEEDTPEPTPAPKPAKAKAEKPAKADSKGDDPFA